LAAIAAGQVDKLVLARSLALQAAAPPAVAPILRALIKTQGNALIYAHGQDERVFLGATPERLLRKRGAHIDADALAGTAWPGSPQLAASKNQREQFFVAHAVDRALRPFCPAPPTLSPVDVRQAGHLQHLHSRIEAQTRPDVSPWSLLAALHPTPAVNGFPGEAARRWLSEHGEDRPAWYSGGIGHIDSTGDCDLHVALRCATLDGRHIALHAGAGLVAGADPAQELAETQAKMTIMLNALGSHSPVTIAQQNEGLEAYT
jgi:isochorismate synthase EntC